MEKIESDTKVKFGYLIIIGSLLLAVSFATITAITIANTNAIQKVERAHRVTLCILLTQPEERTSSVVINCRDNTPTLEELPGIAQNLLDEEQASTTTTTEGG
jgi:hypothetical protein